MTKTVRIFLATACVLFAAPGCDLVDDFEPLEEFHWEAVEDPETIAEGVTHASFYGEVAFLGQFKTPTLCYTLDGDFRQDGRNLTLEVDARTSSAQNCLKTPGGFRYSGVLRHLAQGAYTLRVIHNVAGMAPKEFIVEVDI